MASASVARLRYLSSSLPPLSRPAAAVVDAAAEPSAHQGARPYPLAPAKEALPRRGLSAAAGQPGETGYLPWPTVSRARQPAGRAVRPGTCGTSVIACGASPQHGQHAGRKPLRAMTLPPCRSRAGLRRLAWPRRASPALRRATPSRPSQPPGVPQTPAHLSYGSIADLGERCLCCARAVSREPHLRRSTCLVWWREYPSRAGRESGGPRRTCR